MSPSSSRTLLLANSAFWALGAVLLFAGLAARNGGLASDGAVWNALFRLHDIAAVLAASTTAAVAWSVRSIAIREGGMPIAWPGTICGIATAFFLVLPFVNGASDMFYMLPQSGIGLWLIALCATKSVGFGNAPRIVGTVSGIGLVLIGIGFVMIATALGAPWALANARSLPVTPADFASPLNQHGHGVLWVGTLVGIPTYPVWAWLASRGFRSAAQPNSGRISRFDR